MGFAKMGTEALFSTFCFSIWPHILKDLIDLAKCKSSAFVFQFSRVNEILLPPLRQALSFRPNCTLVTKSNFTSKNNMYLVAFINKGEYTGNNYVINSQ